MTVERILGVGLISVDNLFLVRKGTFGENSEVEGVSPKEKWPCRYIGSHGGGSASNTVCILSKLGFDTAVFGITGNDSGSKIVYDEFKRFGVNADLVTQREGMTRQFSHLIFPKYHEFQSICPICGNELPRAPQLRGSDQGLVGDILKDIEGRDILHIDRSNPLTLRLVEAAYAQRKLVSFDFGYQAWWGDYDRVCEIIRRTDILKTSRAAARTFLSRMSKRDFREINPNLLISIVTHGHKGAEVSYKSEDGIRSELLPPFEPQPVIDQAGAGDAFQAGLLYGLSKGNPDLDKSQVSETVMKEALRMAAGFAGLACTDYGSRGYFLKKLEEPNFESSILNDVSALTKGHYVASTADADALFAEKRNQLLSNRMCGVCGQPFLKNSNTLYEQKIDSAPWAMASSYQEGISSKTIMSAPDGHRVYLVGSGASFCVALLGAFLLNQLTESFAVATTPYDYVSLSKPGSSVVLISFGGNNPDIVSALKRARDTGSREIHILTGSNRSQLAREGESVPNSFVHCVSAKVSDSGFVSTQGMLSCASLLVGFLMKSFSIESQDVSDFFGLQNLTNVFIKAKSDVAMSMAEAWHTFDEMAPPPHLVALGSGWAWPAVTDFESKITEGAVCTIEVSELKNYTHGRYLNAYSNKDSRVFVLFGMPSDDRLIRFLKEKLSRDFPVIKVTTEMPPPRATIDLMIRSLYLSSEISKRLNMDIAKAWRFPRESRGLFSWGPIYSPGSERIDRYARRKPSKETSERYQAKLT